MSDEKRPGQKRLELDLPRDTARGAYANGTVVSHGANEIVLDFVAALPHHKPQVVSRVVLPPAQARALLRTLKHNLERWEATHGKGGTPAARSGHDEEPN